VAPDPGEREHLRIRVLAEPDGEDPVHPGIHRCGDEIGRGGLAHPEMGVGVDHRLAP
jgi:hypothetical protein